jgi:hypothetical protein
VVQWQDIRTFDVFAVRMDKCSPTVSANYYTVTIVNARDAD